MRRFTTEILVGVVLATMTLAVYAPAGNNGFVDYDDQMYVTQNPHVQAGLTGPGLRWAWTAEKGFWHPLTWMSLQLDAQLFGLRAAGYHWTNVLLHAANVLLVYAA